MPIEFRCSQCGKLLRTGDETAGAIPGRNLHAGLLQHLASDRDDQPGVLGRADEVGAVFLGDRGLTAVPVPTLSRDTMAR